ncbi:MAG TPA: serine/threonine-protein kinase, partial [Anaerolineales bacterium]|nr:serine/threonine-protein kinase [Anaerolineales bacterium]
MSGLTGQSMGRYHILDQLGQGGMATVYKAYDMRLERDVVIKVIRQDAFPSEQQSELLVRFEREAKVLARLAHPNIVPIIDYGEHDGVPYLVMPLLPGGTLKQRLGKPLPWQETFRLLLPIADALAYAHEKNILHRDVKPSNILLTQKGQPMLTDFGIAKILDFKDGQTTLTASGIIVGTPEYMSPEQGLGRPVGPQTDIYALGVVLYELLTGRKPFVADTPLAVVLKQATDPLPRPSQFVRDLPEAVEKILFKALAKDPADRYQSMTEMAAAMERTLSGQPSVVSAEGAWTTDRELSIAPLPSGPHRLPSEDKVATVDQSTQALLDATAVADTVRAEPSTHHLGEAPKLRQKFSWVWMIGLAVIFSLLVGGILIRASIEQYRAVQVPAVTQVEATVNIQAKVTTPPKKQTPSSTQAQATATTQSRIIRPENMSNLITLQTLQHRSEVLSVAFSPDGQTIASAPNVYTVQLWRVVDGTLLRTLEGHTDMVFGMAFSPDGQTLASGSLDDTVRLWRVSDGTLLRTLEGHAGEVLSVAFSPDGQILASGS